MFKIEVESLRRLLRSKRAISPILATLLLIVIAVGAIIVTYAWVMTFIGAQTTAGGTILDPENVYWNVSASTTTITVRNVGTSDATIVRLYAGITTLSLPEVTQYTDLGNGKYLPRDQKVTIVLSWPNAVATSWVSGERYYFKVSPEQGSPIEFDARAP